MKIAIFGGSFDPVHNEHVEMVKNAIDEFGFDKVFVLPAYIPPHRVNDTRENFEHRVNMLKIAFSGLYNVEVSNYEKSVQGLSYTYLTIEYFKNKFPLADLYFMVGTDMLLDFPSWRYPERILDKCTLLVTKREGDNFNFALKKYNEVFKKEPLVAFKSGKNLSSTKVKAYLKLNLSVSEYLSQKVIDYIKYNNLYQGGYLEEFVKKSLTLKRLIHTANVEVLAVRYAKRLKVDSNKALISALLHDVAKYLDASDYADFVCEKDVPKQVVHQYLGEYIARKILKIDDEDILNAIKYHTTGRANMSTLEKIVFLADLLEEGRNYPGVEQIRKRVDEDFERGFSFAVYELMRHLKESGQPIYHKTEECLNYYKKTNGDEI